MNTKDIQMRLDAMSIALLAKGVRAPEAEFELESNSEPSLWIRWAKAGGDGIWDKEYNKIEGLSIIEKLNAADMFISELPTAAETRHRDFMAALGNVIDLGRENGIEVAFVNPLVETMKKLSENVLTYQKVAAE